MKTIEVSDEMYDFLMDLSKELNTQDNRITRMPYIFQIEETQEILAADGCGDEIWINTDGDPIELRNDEEIKEAIFDHYGWDLNNEDHISEYDDLDEYDIEEILEDKLNFRKINVTTQKVYKNAFLTEKACRDHISRNGYHYNEPRDFLTHAFRNPELEKLMTFLCELTGGKLHT